MSRAETVRQDDDSRSMGSRLMSWAWQHQVGWMVAAAVVLTGLFQLRQFTGERPARAAAQPEQTAEKEGRLPAVSPHDVMALVNGQDITREALTQACLQRYGEQVLESLVNKRMIMSHCAKRGITISAAEIAAEVDRMAQRFKLGREQWLEMLHKERGISADEYASDIVWPTLALRKLAEGSAIEVTEAEKQRAFEQEFGEMVRARLIAVEDAQLAEELQAKLAADPSQFARMAIEHSIDINSASVGGLIQPIRRHVGDARIEQVAFQLQPGEISPVIQVANQYVLLQCEGRIPARKLSEAEVQNHVVEKIRDEKLRQVAHGLFERLQSAATVQNVYNNPRLRQTMPGVVATVNGDRITLKELGEVCLRRYGEGILEHEISHKLLRQALQRENLQVTQADLDAEVRHAAVLAGVVDEHDQPDLETWFQTVAQEQGMSKAQYYQSSVWPSAALKKLTAPEVQVTEADMQKGFEANFGEMVRCRAIVLGNMRRAQEVWEKARQNPSADYFGDLAEEYSIEPTTRSLRGEVPPIKRHSGQQQLEKAAFQLQPGQLSGIVQTGDKFIVLRCEGRTERMNVERATVDAILRRDIYEKKLRLAMNEKFAAIRAAARIDNYLAGTSQAPPARAEDARAVHRDVAVRPTAAER